MEARVKVDSPFAVVTACSGVTFTRHAWTPVPAGMEAEATRNPYLETLTVEVPTPEVTPLDESPPAVYEATATALAYANTRGLDLAFVTGTGANGKITLTDVKAYYPEE